MSVDGPFQEKIMHLVAKHNALDDCMAAVKKGYEREAITFDEFLKHIRELSMKQCKQIMRMQRIQKALTESSTTQEHKSYPSF